MFNPTLTKLFTDAVSRLPEFTPGTTLDWTTTPDDSAQVVTAYVVNPQGECQGYAWGVVPQGKDTPKVQHPWCVSGSLHLGNGVYWSTL